MRVYLYRFSFINLWVDYIALGNYHISELFFVFPNQWPPVAHVYGPHEYALADSFNTYWTNFARNGDPNNSTSSQSNEMNESENEEENMKMKANGQPVWPLFNDNTKSNIVLKVPPSVEKDYARDICNFWASLGIQ